MPAPDPGIAAMAAEKPCLTRRWLVETGQTTVLNDHAMFPLDGQKRDTPAGVAQRTTDSEW